jgi:hypothetical protein
MMFKKGSFKKGDVVTWVGDRVGEDIKGKGFDVLVTEDVEVDSDMFSGVVVRADQGAYWTVGSNGGDEECWLVSSFKLVQQNTELKEEKKMKDVEQYIKPFNRFEMANGKRGVFLEYKGKVCGFYFEKQEGCSWQCEPVFGGDENFRITKVWQQSYSSCLFLAGEFDYNKMPIWQEENEEQRERRKQIEQLEETIKKAQQQIEQLKETR